MVSDGSWARWILNLSNRSEACEGHTWGCRSAWWKRTLRLHRSCCTPPRETTVPSPHPRPPDGFRMPRTPFCSTTATQKYTHVSSNQQWNAKKQWQYIETQSKPTTTEIFLLLLFWGDNCHFSVKSDMFIFSPQNNQYESLCFPFFEILVRTKQENQTQILFWWERCKKTVDLVYLPLSRWCWSDKWSPLQQECCWWCSGYSCSCTKAHCRPPVGERIMKNFRERP